MRARFSVLLGLWCGVALAQTQSITGTVINAADSTPIAGVTVTLGGGNASQTVLTDAGGKFIFGGVPPGGYSLSAQRTGYLGSGGQHVATAFVNVEVKGQPDPIVIRLALGATLTGSVTDEAGLPLPNPTVGLIHRLVSNGRGRLVAENQTGGNDLGEFRLSGVAAGRYLVCVNATASSYQRHHRLTYPTTCFPGVTDVSSAQWVTLGPGEERKLTFRMNPVPGIRASGTVDNAGKGTSVWLKRTDPPGFPLLSQPPVTWDEKTSSFEIPAVSSGDYLITANMFADGQNRRAMRTFHAGNEDIHDIRLRLGDGPYVSGTVRMGDMGDTPAPAQNRIGGVFGGGMPSLAPPGLAPPPPTPVTVTFDGESRLTVYANGSGSFKQPMNEPGNYSVDVIPLPGWSLQAITQGGVDIRDRKIAIGVDADPDPIEIVLQRGGGAIEVSVQNPWGKAISPVRLILLRRLSTENEWAQQGQPMVVSRAGALSWRNVPSGEYTLFAWPAATEIEYLDPEVIEKYQSFGQAVSVRESETTRLTVKPVSIE